MDAQKEREAFERFKAEKIGIAYEELKVDLDDCERRFGKRYAGWNFSDDWEVWQAAKASVAEWISVKDRLPEDGQKCLVIFEMRHSKDDACRYINIDYFNEGDFDSVINWEDQASSVALPAGSVISRFKAVYWSPTGLSVEHLVFNEA